MSVTNTNKQNKNDHHDVDQVWSVVRELQSGQAQSQSSQSEFNARLGGVEQKLDQLATMITNYITKPQKEFNWIGFGSLVIGILLCAGAYSSAIIGPIRKSTEGNHTILMSRINQLPNDYKEAGKQEARIEMQWDLIRNIQDRVNNIEDLSSSTRATQEEMLKTVNNVDLYGSRKHILSVPEAFNQQ